MFWKTLHIYKRTIISNVEVKEMKTIVDATQYGQVFDK